MARQMLSSVLTALSESSKWLLRQLMQSLGCASPRDAVIDGHVVRTDVVEIIRGELDECALVGERYSKNYNCWSYRREALKWSLDRATVRGV